MWQSERCLLIVFLWLSMVLATPAFGDLQSLRERWLTLQQQEAAILAPKLYELAEREVERVEAAARADDEGALRKRLESAESRMDALGEAVAQARELWADVLDERSMAIAAGADSAAVQTFQSAENILLAAAKKLEAGRQAAAQRQVEESLPLYRQARREAERFALVGHSQERLARAEKLDATLYAPRSYVRALDAVKRVEQLLQSRGFDDPMVQAAAAEAEIESRHAIYLLERLRGICAQESPERMESAVVDWEDAVSLTMRSLGVEPRFDQGLQGPLRQVQLAVDRLLRERNRMRSELERRATQIDSLQQVIDELKLNVVDFEGKIAALAPFEEDAKTIDEIQRRFAQSEGRVLVENRDLILRLHGLRFESGESEIPVENYFLLEKVLETVRELPGSHLIIEGHTDSTGREGTNMRLSQERAQAVRDYLVNQGGILPGRLTTIGYGSARPVASNDTEEGRALNRRIEIIISRPG